MKKIRYKKRYLINFKKNFTIQIFYDIIVNSMYYKLNLLLISFIGIKGVENQTEILLDENKIQNVLDSLKNRYNREKMEEPYIFLHKNYSISLKELAVFFVFISEIMEDFLKNNPSKIYKDIYELYLNLKVNNNDIENVITLIDLLKHYLIYEKYNNEKNLDDAYKEYVQEFFFWQLKIMEVTIPMENTEISGYLDSVKGEFENINYDVYKIILNMEKVINWSKENNKFSSFFLNSEEISSMPINIICPLVSNEYIKMEEMIQNYRYWLWGRKIDVEKKIYIYYIISDVVKKKPLNKEDFIEMKSFELLKKKIEELSKTREITYDNKKYLLGTFIDKLLRVFFKSIKRN
ncbi:hypothetical protein AB836_00810 [Rickettsiales bacterium (ex Bugula neritina AB1)]|nr:hypothetical protein AB836_00810 [Rickettsiales bacterium (ex Bugula neritina AB1)]